MEPDYDPNTIVVLKGLEAMRKRPGMYIGDTDSDQGLLQLLWESLGNCVDQYAAGQCQTIWLEIAQGNRVTISDDGPGFLDLMMGETPLLTCALTQPHAGPSLTGHTPHDHLSDYGLGLVAIAAFSSELTLRTTRDGVTRHIAMANGEVTQPEWRELSAQASGTYLSFVPDPKFFGTRQHDSVAILSRLEEVAALNPQLHIHYKHQQSTRILHAPDGLAALLPTTDVSANPLFRFSQNITNAKLSVVLAVRDASKMDPNIRCFANQLVCQDGPHRRGLLDGLKRAMKAIVAQRKILLCGFDAVVRLQLSDPKYAGPTKEVLSAAVLQAPIAEALHASLLIWLLENPTLVSKLWRAN
jgi:DNA gyrase subunit B